MTAPPFRLHLYEELPSTQDHLVHLAEAGEPEGLAVLARRQSAGRGTQGRRWIGAEGNLHLSVLLRPDDPARRAPLWGMLAAVAMADAVSRYLPPPRLSLKWPNDLLLDGAKAGGVLTQTAARADGRMSWLVLGFGVNLTTAPVLAERATTALAPAGVTPPDPESFAQELLAALARRRQERAQFGFAPIRMAWLAYGPAMGTVLNVCRADNTERGYFAGLGEDGSLLLAVAGGEIRAIAVGEVI